MEAAPAALGEGEAADQCDLSCSNAALHAPKRCRDVEDAGEDKSSSESQHGGPSMKRNGRSLTPKATSSSSESSMSAIRPRSPAFVSLSYSSSSLLPLVFDLV